MATACGFWFSVCLQQLPLPPPQQNNNKLAGRQRSTADAGGPEGWLRHAETEQDGQSDGARCSTDRKAAMDKAQPEARLRIEMAITAETCFPHVATQSGVESGRRPRPLSGRAGGSGAAAHRVLPPL